MAKTYTSKACEVLSVLTEQQKHRFLAFLTGEVGKDTHPVHRLGAYVVRTVKKDRPMIDAAQAWLQLYAPKPAPPEDSRKLSQHMSTLGRYAEEFLAIERFRSQAPLKRIHTIEALNEQKLGHLNGYHLQRLREELDQAEVIHPEHYQWVYKATKLERYQFVLNLPGGKDIPLKDMLHEQIRVSLMESLRHTLTTYSSNKYIKESQIAYTSILLLIGNIPELKDKIITKLMFFNEMARKNLRDNDIKTMMHILTEERLMKNDVKNEIYIFIFNATIRYADATGTRDARSLIWFVMYQGLCHGLMAAYGNVISPLRLRLFMNAAAWSGEVTRKQLQEIIQGDQMQQILPETGGVEELLLCEAYYDMLEGDYHALIARLEAARFNNPSYRGEAKILALKGLYEHMSGSVVTPNEFDLENFLSKVAYAKRMLAELTNLEVRFRDLFQEELTVLPQLVRAITREQLLHLREKINQSVALGYTRFWYQEKVEQRLASLT